MWKIESWFGNSTLPPTLTTVTRGTNALLFMVTVAPVGRVRSFGPSTQTIASSVSCACLPSFSSTATLPWTFPAATGAAAQRTIATSPSHVKRILVLCLRTISGESSIPGGGPASAAHRIAGERATHDHHHPDSEPSRRSRFTRALLEGARGARPQHEALEAASYYTVRLDDPKAVFVTRERFGAVGDGIADDTAALQKAIDAVQETTGEGVVFVPEGRYRLSATLYVWPGIRVIGYGTRRPAFVLGDRTPGYQDPEQPRYMVFFAGRRPKDGAEPPDANPGTFYSALSNVDLEIGAGNAGAVGVRARYAQHCFTSHVEFRIGSGLAGIHEGGNVAEDVRFVGGEYGIWTGTPSPGWQYTLLDARFEGQRRAAIRERRRASR